MSVFLDHYRGFVDHEMSYVFWKLHVQQLSECVYYASSKLCEFVICNNWHRYELIFYIQSDSRFYGPIYLGKNCELSKWIQVVTPPLLANFHSPPPAKRTNSYSEALSKELFLETLNNNISFNIFSFLVSLTYFWVLLAIHCWVQTGRVPNF